MEEKNKQKADVFRYISLHSFIRDVFNGYDTLKFSSRNFLKAFKSYVESEDEELTHFKNNGILAKLGRTSENKIIKILDSMQVNSKNKDISGTKKTMFDFLNEISKNSISGKTMMETFVVLNASIGVEVDCSKLRPNDFKSFSKDEQERLSRGIVNLSMIKFKNSNSKDELDMSEAIIMVENSLKNKNNKKERSDDLIVSMNKRINNKKMF